jgi:hypothetical protein
MRAVLVILLFCYPAGAQDSPVVRGVVLAREAGPKGGELKLRDARNNELRYRFDAHTYVERDNRSIDAAELQPGEPVEVVSEAVPGSLLRAARSIHVLSPVPIRRRPPAKPFDTWAADVRKADLTFSGLILRVSESRLFLHQREGGDQEILLRPDTRCANNGETVAANNLKPNMHVFVRAAKNEAGETEAYQVLWGSMLTAK